MLEFANAASDPVNWSLPAKSYSGDHYTEATEIAPANIGNLHLAWTFRADDEGPTETSPIVYNATSPLRRRAGSENNRTTGAIASRSENVH